MKIRILKNQKKIKKSKKMSFTMWTDNGNFDLDLTDPYVFFILFYFFSLILFSAIDTSNYFFAGTIDAKVIVVE